jgi:serine/threonine protein kinase
MPIEKLTKKEYYATAKSDVYAMGVMFFELIAGHHPYLISVKKNDNREYIKQLRENELQLKPNFTNCFSIRFHHLFELILKMVAKEEE